MVQLVGKRRFETEADLTNRPRKRLKEAEREAQKGSIKEKAIRLQPIRHALPIWAEREQIITAIAENDVVLLVGETGSGKSTQVPQLLLEHQLLDPKTISIDGQDVKIGGEVAVTEPRRVAATNLAQRVAAEMGTTLGKSSPASKVGYSVRFDTSVAPCMKIKFLTEGMLLQEMLLDPWLKQYSVVIVDEAHERSMNVDLILGFLKQMVDKNFEGRGGQRLKVVVMSATLELEDLTRFFEVNSEKPAGDQQPAENGEPTKKRHRKKKKQFSMKDFHVPGRQFKVEITHTESPEPDYLDATANAILSVHTREPMPGDILVFLPGQDDIETLLETMVDVIPALPLALPTMMVLPFFAALPPLAQNRVFQPTPYSFRPLRKVILSTNIAETSVTIPGVRHVIDAGLQKTKQYRSQLAIESLLVTPISQSSARQRAGRAGREAAGTCTRLYTKEQFDSLLPNDFPEILRVDVTSAVLKLKARGVDNVLTFPFISSPSRDNLTNGLLTLHNLGALSSTSELTPLGKQMARFPLSPALARVLVAAAEPEFDCLSEVADIISCLSVESMFLAPTSEEMREAAAEARQLLYRREGDLLTMLVTLRNYTTEKADRKRWADEHFVNHRAMQAVCKVRQQLKAQVENSKLGVIKVHKSVNKAREIDALVGVRILKCFLTAFAHRTARLMQDGGYRTVVRGQNVAIHPSSVLFGGGANKKYEAIMYMEYVHTSKGYARCVSAVQMDWIGEAMERMGRTEEKEVVVPVEENEPGE